MFFKFSLKFHVLQTNLRTHSHRKQPLEITYMLGKLSKFHSFYCLHFYFIFFLKLFYRLQFCFQSPFFSLSLTLLIAFESNVFLTSEISNLFLHLLFSCSLFLCLHLSYPPHSHTPHSHSNIPFEYILLFVWFIEF